MDNEKTYLKPGDIIIADSVILIYDGTKYILAIDGLAHAEKYIIDPSTEQECPIEYELTEENIKPYYQPSPILTKMQNINENIFG